MPEVFLVELPIEPEPEGAVVGTDVRQKIAMHIAPHEKHSLTTDRTHKERRLTIIHRPCCSLLGKIRGLRSLCSTEPSFPNQNQPSRTQKKSGDRPRR